MRVLLSIISLVAATLFVVSVAVLAYYVPWAIGRRDSEPEDLVSVLVLLILALLFSATTALNGIALGNFSIAEHVSRLWVHILNGSCLLSLASLTVIAIDSRASAVPTLAENLLLIGLPAVVVISGYLTALFTEPLKGR